MPNEIMKVTPSEAIAIGKQFFESGMFTDIKSAGMAVVKIMAGAEIGIPPFAAMSGIHIIQGKPTIGAGLIASAVKGSGKYNYKVIEQNEKVCSIDFYQGKEKIGNSTFTIQDAAKAQTKNIDKFPRNMLFARAISNGVKWYCPDVFAGPVYVPEEMTEDANAEVVPSSLDVEVGAAIVKVIQAKTIADLKKLKKTLANEVIVDPRFSNEAIRKFNELTNAEPSIDDKELLHNANADEANEIHS